MTQDYRELEQEKHKKKDTPSQGGNIKGSGCLGRSQVQGESDFLCFQ